MTGAIGQRWQVTGGRAVIEIIGTADTHYYQTQVVYSPPDNRDAHFSLGHIEGYFRERFTDTCPHSGNTFEYLPGQDRPTN